ncbi:hypothetical protein AWZ03_005809 [Drosophila navojoa]|uniref:Uncharacterized protein n=1 Tax=Drosophila navojoa TaxID=7232 RepID=A0A484BJ74_DRONA|nr:hypothetical protein AWZ03_005809 [Drosophila navojoa]
MSGKKPFHKTDPAYTDAGIPYQTVRGVRPDLKDLNFCENVEIMKDLIEQGWDGEPCKRPSMKIFACYLALIIHR